MAEWLYAHVAAFFYSQLWAIQIEKLEAMRAALEFVRAGGHYSAAQVEAITAAASNPRASAGSVAVLPLFGVLSHRANMVTEASGGTSTERFGAAFRQALNDPSIGAIVLDVDSPGGSVNGIPELANEIRSARGAKPILAAANSLAASAAYWVATAADELYVTPSGEVGSVGVYAIHQDESGAYQGAGVKTTIVSAGKFKTEGNPYEPLSDEARTALQGRIDEYYGMFVRDVAKGRGVPIDSVREGFGEGRVVGARQAQSEGMVDGVATFDEVIARAGKLIRQRSAPAAELELRNYQARRFGP